MNHVLALACSAALLAASAAQSATVDFEDLTLPADSYWTGEPEVDGGFVSRGVFLRNHYYENWGFMTWNGFAYSNVNDTTTAGYGNQYAVVSGTGRGGGGIYAVAYDDHYAAAPTAVIPFPAPMAPGGVWLNNTTYAARYMEGDDGGFTNPPPFDSGDWFLLTISAFDGAHQALGSPIGFYLADFRSANPLDHYIVRDWTFVDLTGFGDAVERLEFTLSSSDVSIYGMNTPGYFAMDDLQIIPEPGALAFALIGLAGLAFARARRRAGV
jgi:hypothetical protein